MLRIVADLGNSRLKWGRVDQAGDVVESTALPNDEPASWDSLWSRWGLGNDPSEWAITTVNPPVARRLASFLAERDVDAAKTRWYRSAADVPTRHLLEAPETAGADRALAVDAAVARHPAGRPGLVVSCGTAITVERIDSDGVWQGGAIAPGLALASKALHLLTAQLPLIMPCEAPAPWGRSTRPALEAGLFWGVVGSIRELLTRQAVGLTPRPWLVWTGGDAPILAPTIEWDDVQVVPDLVLDGLARIAFAREETTTTTTITARPPHA